MTRSVSRGGSWPRSLALCTGLGGAALGVACIGVQKPDVSGSISSEQGALLVAITADNRIYFDGQEIQAEQVATVLKQAAIGRAPTVIVRGDRASSLGVFATVYTEAKRAGIPNVQFATARAD